MALRSFEIRKEVSVAIAHVHRPPCSRSERSEVSVVAARGGGYQGKRACVISVDIPGAILDLLLVPLLGELVIMPSQIFATSTDLVFVT